MPETPRRLGGAVAVAAGIFLSRIAGLVRERVIAHYLGTEAAAAAFKRALQIPNLLQVLLGEGVLSASFIPVYSRLIGEGRHEEASRVARVIGTLLALLASAIAVLGVVLADPLVDVLAPGFTDSTRELTVQLVRIMFPGTALLVMSAWCLGVLNSHRLFFLSYVSPVLWNAALIAAAVVAGRRFAGSEFDVAWWLAWGAVIGSAAQFLVQLPTVIRLLRGLAPSLDVHHAGVRSTLRAFVPVLFGRGSVQISAYIDQSVSSFLGERVVAAMTYAQTLYVLPVSLFGMAISAAELPEMSSGTGDDAARAKHVHERLSRSLRRVVFFVVPSAIAFATIGGSIAGLVFQTGKFSHADTELVWLILAGASLGLLPNTIGRLFGSAFYALGDPKAPLRSSLVRITIGTGLGCVIALPLRDALGYSAEVGAVGIMAASGLAGWVELALLHRWLSARIGKPAVPWKLIAIALVGSLAAGGLGYLAGHVAGTFAPYWLAALVAIAVFGGVYFVAMAIAKQPEATAILRRLRIVR
jgi:putative peptidoglycan lipid II flippase